AQSLPLLLIGVVGGIAHVSAPLLRGLLLQFFSTVGENFTLHASARIIGPLSTTFALIPPGLIGHLQSRNTHGLDAHLITAYHRAGRWVREERSRPEQDAGPDPLDPAVFERPLTPAQLAAVDRALGLDPQEVAHGPA